MAVFDLLPIFRVSVAGAYMAGQQALQDLRTDEAARYFSQAAKAEWDNPVLVERSFIAYAADAMPLFEKAGIAFVEPERRESAADLKKKRRPKLVSPSDLRGTFHVHTTFSDGRNTVLQMLTAARDRGFDGKLIHTVRKAGYVLKVA